MTSIIDDGEAVPVHAKHQGHAYWREKLKSARYVVAPMVDQSELAWRMLSRAYGAELCYTPMFHANNFAKDPIYRRENFTTCAADRPLIVQFCANDPSIFSNACEFVQMDCDGVDLNLGCPQTIARRGHYGAFLQDEWELIHQLVTTVHRNLSVPISCKVRVFDDLRRTVDYAKMLESAGCQLLTVHGRTREQKGPKTGLANWDYIKIVKESVGIPVFANGNIQYYADIQRCLEATGAEGVMTAEGNLHNPALFANRQPPVWEMALEYLDLVERYPCSPSFIRGHLFKLCHHSLSLFHDLRVLLAGAETVEEFRSICQELKSRCEPSHTVYLENGQFESGSLPFPHWICQPYVRPATLSEPAMNVSEEILAEIAATRKEIKAKVSLMASEAGMSKRKAKKYVKHNVSPTTVRKRMKATYISCDCGNPAGNNCVSTLCRLCCRAKCIEDILDCAGHRFWYKKSLTFAEDRRLTVPSLDTDEGACCDSDSLS